jgi:GGDEF domain-containing protein
MAAMLPPWLRDLEDLLDVELVDGAPESPFRPAILRWAAANGRPVDPLPLLEALEASRIGGRGGSRRYRWSFPVAGWIALEERLRWRPAEAEIVERHGDKHAARLWEPPILVEHVEWLDGVGRGGDDRQHVAARARVLLSEAMPTVEDDVAQRVAGADAWGDTFLLWVFARRPRVLDRVPGLVSAVAARYAARAARTDGLVHGRSYPFFDIPIPSATAHLAAAAARTGEGLELVARAAEWLRSERRRDGGWGDPRQPTDLLTTLAVAELFGQLDATFEPASVLDVMELQVRERGGRPELVGPEWPWLAAEILAFATWSGKPFRERFRWPHVPTWMTDPGVSVPRKEAFAVDARLFSELPGLASLTIECGFIDLAGFGEWNTEHGQDEGDKLLALLAAQLRAVPDSRVIRDGGDEFLVLAAPMADGLQDRLQALFARWPDVSRERFPDLPIVPLRAVVGRGPAGELRSLRERLGEAIGPVKHANQSPPPEGVVVQLG